MYSTNNKKNKRFAKKWIVLLVVAVLLIGGGVYWRLRIYKPASEVITTAGNLSQGATPNVSVNSPSQKKQPTSNTGRTIGGGIDTKGQTGTTTNPSQWITSKSGTITVEQPIANATVHSGSYLVGTAKVGTVSFRLSDDSVGEIAEGTLQVVNGKFSGKLGFTPHASAGELDVFSTNSRGVEFNEIQIAVRF
jgi:cytoskeletal protein RodZ